MDFILLLNLVFNIYYEIIIDLLFNNNNFYKIVNKCLCKKVNLIKNNT